MKPLIAVLLLASLTVPDTEAADAEAEAITNEEHKEEIWDFGAYRLEFFINCINN